MHKPQVKAHYPTHFNDIVQHDLFFLFDQTFMLLIDECIKYNMGDHLTDKRGPTIARALYKLWIRVWGPSQNLLSDQEGGLLSNEATRMFDKLNINRLLVGTSGSTTKGLVERHIAITKTAMLKLQKQCKDEGLEVSLSDICYEACMAQNQMLEYAGGTPQLALT